jgi:hypothetical protein
VVLYSSTTTRKEMLLGTDKSAGEERVRKSRGARDDPERHLLYAAGRYLANNETSVAEVLERTYAVLLEDLHKLEEEAAHPASGEVAELCRWLEGEREHITEHFRFEEQNGYMDAVQKWESRLEWTIEQLAQKYRAGAIPGCTHQRDRGSERPERSVLGKSPEVSRKSPAVRSPRERPRPRHLQPRHQRQGLSHAVGPKRERTMPTRHVTIQKSEVKGRRKSEVSKSRASR